MAHRVTSPEPWVPWPVIKVLCRFTIVLFGAVADTSPTWHLEEAWLLFYEEFAFLTHSLDCLKKNPTSLCFSSVFCFCDYTWEELHEKAVRAWC